MLRGHNPLASEGAWAFIGDVSAYPLSHFILPFTMHLFFENFWMVLCCCYLYESFEALLDAEFVEKGKAAPGPLGWEGVPEPKLDSLIGDPLMSLLGLMTAKMFRVCFYSEDQHGLFPSEKGGVLRRAFLFATFAVPSFFVLNWDPVLKNQPEGWTKETPLPAHGFRLGDLIFATNYLIMIRVVFGFQGDSSSSKLYIAWASVAAFFFLGILFLGSLIGFTTYQRLLVQWLIVLAAFLVYLSYHAWIKKEEGKRTCPLFPSKGLLQNRDDEDSESQGSDCNRDIQASEESVLADSSQV